TLAREPKGSDHFDLCSEVSTSHFPRCAAAEGLSPPRQPRRHPSAVVGTSPSTTRTNQLQTRVELRSP
ncbi:hypothetical protein K438DRAFT_1855210, partial [Mycena galopus ATCC 62051]